MSTSRFVIVDDYHSWPACQRAVDEFRRDRSISAPMQRIDWTAAYWRLAPGLAT